MRIKFRPQYRRPLRDERGQVAIFIALIFQLLFLFFAMVINVGLLVHHKINLQNSVDLAAYYGAMKQAEVLNAIGHVNFQIRQSYKLLSWRYRILGTAGVWPEQAPSYGNPTSKQGNGVNTGVNGATLNKPDPDGYDRSNTDLDNFYQRPDFCVAFRPFAEIKSGESTCQTPAGQTIADLITPPKIASFIGAVGVAQQVTQMANEAKKDSCETSGPYNYAMLARFIVSYNLDQGDRKRLIYKLANNLSAQTGDFLDIAGESAATGITTTVNNNLTPANHEGNLKVQIFNSLAAGGCGQKANGQAPGWLADVVIYPRASYKMCVSGGGASTYLGKNVDYRPSVAPPGQASNTGPEGDMVPLINYLSSYLAISDASNPDRPTLGVEKNPWCMAYVGVRADADPKIPFSLGTVHLKAVAYAKPFGGRIGPWYGRTWAPGTPESTGIGPDQRTDPRTPVRCPLGNFANCSVQGTDAATTLNYSRFPGDPAGLASQMVQGQYSKSIFDLGLISVAGWDGVEVSPQNRGGDWDMLNHGTDNPSQQMRKLETAALVPDMFDLTYYSIDADFYGNYYTGKLENYVKNNPPASNYVMRLDLGSRLSGSNLSNGRPAAAFNVKDQMDVAGNIPAGATNSYGLDWSGKLPYAVVNSSSFGELLTGWVSLPDLSTYGFDSTRFGHCLTPALPNVPSPGTCTQGGRTGYSVKLVASDYLQQEQSLGGQGVSSSKILNLPPDSFLE